MDANDEPRVEEEGAQDADVDDGKETSQGWSSPFGDLQELVDTSATRVWKWRLRTTATSCGWISPGSTATTSMCRRSVTS